MSGAKRARPGANGLGDRLAHRRGPLYASAVIVIVGMAYTIWWAPLVRHGSYWVMPQDLWGGFLAALDASHGHFGQIYSPSTGFVSFPGLVLVLVPFAALSDSLHLGTETPGLLVAHPSAWLLLGPLSLLLSTVALFACDAVAERLGVKSSRRVALMVIEGIVLWNVVVFWGHPEDAMATGLALYALLSGLDNRWRRAGWLFGAALVTQPLVIMVLPILFAVAGKDRALGLVLRGAIPAAVLTLFPLVSNFRQTVHVLADQPTFPNLDHATPWTTLAPTISGRGMSLAVSAGPLRVVGLLLACAVGWRARRWKERPDLLVWGCALALALRCATESVMTDYYVWPALAVGLVAAAALEGNRLVAASGAAFFTTVTAQWGLGEFPWWLLQMLGLAALLLCGVESSSQRQRRLQVQEYLRSRTRPRQRASPRKGSSKTGSSRKT
jgi:hypothetical protein